MWRCITGKEKRRCWLVSELPDPICFVWLWWWISLVWELFLMVIFSLLLSSRMPFCSGVVQEMLIVLAKETRATTFWQLPRLPWLIESDSEHMHTHRHTPTHTVGGKRHKHMHRDAGRRIDRELARHRQMCCKSNSCFTVGINHTILLTLKMPLSMWQKSLHHLKCNKYYQRSSKIISYLTHCYSIHILWHRRVY